MSNLFEKYLDDVNRYLKPLSATERADIIMEIKSLIFEMQRDNFTDEEILSRLGNARDLARAYLGNLLLNEKGFSWRKFWLGFIFYGLVGFSGMCIIPCLVIMAPVFIGCGVLTMVLALLKMVDYILGLGIPYMNNIGVSFMYIRFNPLIESWLALMAGVLLYVAGKWCWKLLISYFKKIIKIKDKLLA